MTWLVTLLSASVLGAACGSSGAGAAEGDGMPRTAAAPAVLTQRDHGRTISLHVGASRTLRVHADEGEIAARGRSVELVQVDYFADPGYREWELHAARAGTTVITGPRTDGRRFRLTIRVTRG